MRKAKRKKDIFVNELHSAASFHIQPKNSTQQYLLECIENNSITVAMGPAGTGKTYCTGMKISQLFLKGQFEKIILSRANVSVGRTLGFFPGTIEDKMRPWLMPMTDVLEQGLGKGRFEYLQKQGTVEVQPIETIRGRSYNNSLIMVDEAQNLSIEEIKAVTTRLGENSKLILSGDPAQSDVQKGNNLLHFAQICSKHDIEIPVVRFTINDIVRSDIVAKLVKMFDRESL